MSVGSAIPNGLPYKILHSLDVNDNDHLVILIKVYQKANLACKACFDVKG